MMSKEKDRFNNVIDAIVDELLAMSDAQVLDISAAADAQSEGRRLLKSAKAQVGRRGLGAETHGCAPVNMDQAATSAEVSKARRFIARMNGGQPTLAARSLTDLSDEEAIRLYRKLKAFDRDRR